MPWSAFAVGLIPFSMFQLLLRGFYAGQNSRTPTLVMIGVGALNVAMMYALSAALPTSSRAVALALAFDIAYAAGAIVLTVLLRRQLHGLDGWRVLRLFVRVAIAGALAAATAYGVVALIQWPGGSGRAVTAARRDRGRRGRDRGLSAGSDPNAGDGTDGSPPARSRADRPLSAYT